MNFIEFDSTSKMVEFNFPDLEELDSITDNLVKQVRFWRTARPGDTNSGFEVGFTDDDVNVPSYDETLYNWLNECLAKAGNFYFPNRKLQFAICDSWLTRSTSNYTASTHSHSCSHLTGIFYLTDNNSQTVFEILPQEVDLNVQTLGHGDYELVKVPSVKGKLIIYPSRLKHRVRVLPAQKNTRYTYIFNAHATGVISSTKSSYLEYTVKDIKARYLEHVNRP
ncbi:MAG: hypothetical protein EBU90_09800 [Proteobacteria bacterium]|nr:hypothetical protein [Pseudomonadota bacterium]NBP14545.1 hypothetical protein [bacterium]